MATRKKKASKKADTKVETTGATSKAKKSASRPRKTSAKKQAETKVAAVKKPEPPPAPEPQPDPPSPPVATEPEPPREETKDEKRARMRAERIMRAKKEAAARRARENGEIVEPEQHKAPRPVVASVPAKAPEEKKGEKPVLRVVRENNEPVDLTEARNIKEHKEVTVSFDSGLCWKYQAKNERRNAIAEKIKTQVVAAFQEQLRQQIVKSVQASPEWLKANDEANSVLNEILESVEPTLPKGYAVTSIEPKDNTVVAKYGPDKIGRRYKMALRQGD